MRKSLRYFTYFIITVLFLSMIVIGGFRKVHDEESVTFGVTFSEKYARELKLEPRKAYSSIVQELPIDKIRLMSYWDLREPEPGSYDFELLDWMMDVAERKAVDVSLAIGLRQPRWPECHTPGWVNTLSRGERNKALLNYIETVVNRYKNHPALDSYQLENEAANRHFGVCPAFDRELIQREYALITKLDPNHTIIINVSNQSGIPLRSPRAQKVGFSIYEHAHFSLVENGKQIKWTYWYLPPSWHGVRAAIIEFLYADETFVHELQGEPWGPKPTIELTNEEQLALMNANKLKKSIDYAKSTGMREIHLWGAEWWYLQKETYENSKPWNTVKRL